MDEPQPQEWTLAVILRVGLLFLLAGLAEIGGGWLVWGALRAGKPWWWAACGSAVLVLYGFVPCLQPISDFGRLYAGNPKPWPRTPTLARADDAVLAAVCSPNPSAPTAAVRSLRRHLYRARVWVGLARRWHKA